jgi:hypothetical protein
VKHRYEDAAAVWAEASANHIVSEEMNGYGQPRGLDAHSAAVAFAAAFPEIGSRAEVERDLAGRVSRLAAAIAKDIRAGVLCARGYTK